MKYLTVGAFASNETTCPTRIIRIILYDFWIVPTDRLLDIVTDYPSFKLPKTGVRADVVSPSENCGPDVLQHSKGAYWILPVLFGQPQSVVDTVRDRDSDVLPLPVLELLA
jgi:hypothetical protein